MERLDADWVSELHVSDLPFGRWHAIMWIGMVDDLIAKNSGMNFNSAGQGGTLATATPSGTADLH